jgi:hypothetical protein
VLRSFAHQVPPSKYSDLVQEMMKNIGYLGEVTHGDVSRPEDTSGPFQMSFDYRRDRGDDWKNLRVLPQLDPALLPIPNEKEPPTSSLSLGTPRTVESHAVMKIPAGWSVELPDAVHAKSTWVTYDFTYRFDRDARSMIADRKIVVLQEKIPVSDWREYKKFTDDAQLQFEFYFILQPSDGKHGGSSSTPKSGNEAKMESLYPELELAYKRKDAKAMEELLKKMKDGDPKPRRYWAWQASVAGLKNKVDDAVADNLKELQLYPDEVDRWESILYWQHRKNDKAGSEQTLRDWAAAQPSDPKPLMTLSTLLDKDGHAAEAIAAAQDAAKRTTAGSKESEGALLLIGEMQLRAGQTDAGKATLVGVLKSSSDPGILNDGSYELAKMKLELPLAEAKSRAGIDALTTESEGWTIDEKLTTLRARSTLLIASWDTLGWILFQEGKFEQAKPWLLAARQNRVSAEVQQHVKQVDEALSKDDPNKVTDLDAAKTDQQMRTIALGNSQGKTGSAEYTLLLSDGKVERTAATGDEKIDGAEAMLRAGDFSKFFPTGSKAKLVRVGILNCVAGKCEIVLEP